MARKRHCKKCGVVEKVDAIGYSHLSPYSSVCVDCTNKATYGS